MNTPFEPPTYTEPVARLLALGEVESESGWMDYRELGLNRTHVAELIRVATDEELHWADQDSPKVWAPVHAWRALGQLRARQAVVPLLGLLPLIDEDDDDWVGEEIPAVLGMIGPPGLPHVAAWLHDPQNGLWARVAAAHTLGQIGEDYPDEREFCVRALTEQLARFEENHRTLNSLLISYLTDLRATESAGVMEEAFAADAVDLFANGDWEEVQIALGLLDKRITPPPAQGWLGREAKGALEETAADRQRKKRQTRKKARQKERKKSMKRRRRS